MLRDSTQHKIRILHMETIEKYMENIGFTHAEYKGTEEVFGIEGAFITRYAPEELDHVYFDYHLPYTEYAEDLYNYLQKDHSENVVTYDIDGSEDDDDTLVFKFASSDLVEEVISKMCDIMHSIKEFKPAQKYLKESTHLALEVDGEKVTPVISAYEWDGNKYSVSKGKKLYGNTHKITLKEGKKLEPYGYQNSYFDNERSTETSVEYSLENAEELLAEIKDIHKQLLSELVELA